MNSRALRKENIDSLKVFSLRHYFLLKSESLFIYLDESNFNNKTRTRKRWVCKRLVRTFYDFGRIVSQNLILAISNSRIWKYFINDRSNTSKILERFLGEMISEINKCKYMISMYNQGEICLIMDNAKIHKSKILLRFLEKSKLRVLFLPPYRPSMNPAEYAFRVLKLQFYRKTFVNR